MEEAGRNLEHDFPTIWDFNTSIESQETWSLKALKLVMPNINGPTLADGSVMDNGRLHVKVVKCPTWDEKMLIKI